MYMLRSKSLLSLFRDTTEIELPALPSPIAYHNSIGNKEANMTTNRDTTRAESLEPGEIVEVLTPPQDGQWCKVFVSKASNAEGREYYFSNLETGESSWEEPRAAYWLWDYGTQSYHVSGLQQPTPKEMRKLFAPVSTSLN
jgi:hypothetical protein